MWAAFTAFGFFGYSRYKFAIAKHRELLVVAAGDSQKAQAFFGTIIRVACLVTGIFNANVLNDFLLTPLSITGIFRAVFGELLLFKYRGGNAFLTAVSFISLGLSTLVLRALYSQFAQISRNTSQYDIYESILYTLSWQREW